MTSILFSIAVSVSLLMIFLTIMKNKIIKNYGFGLIYAVCIILSVRLVIPYSFQLPDINIASFDIPRFIIPVWAAGAVISLIYRLSGYFYFLKQLKRYSSPVLDEDINLIFEQTKNEMFIGRNIPVRFSSKADSPMLKGIIRPEIILTKYPYTSAEYSMIFRHELTHYKNRDNIKKLFLIIVSSLQWFNPFMYLLSANLNESIECLCDEKVVRNKDGNFKRDYSMMILKTAKTRSIPLVSSLSAKEKMKMRLGNIFDNTKKKSSVLPMIAVTVSAVLLSSFFCSCTVDTPDDVKEEMNRIESGIENEQSAEVSDNGELTLKPVSEVTANAEAEIEKLSSSNGIFKFDNTDMIIPQKDELKIYNENKFYGLDSPQVIYDQLKYLEEEWLGYHYPDTSYTAAGNTVNADGERNDITIEKFLKGDGIAPIYLSDENNSRGSIELFYNSLRLWQTPLLIKIREDNPDYFEIDPSEVYHCLDIDEETLSQKFFFSDGDITLKEVINKAESYMNNFKYTVDDKIKFKVQKVEKIPLKDGSCILELYLRVLCDDMPFNYVEFNPNEDSPFGITELYGFDCMEMTMAHSKGYDFILTYGSNTMYTYKDTVKEIISLTDAFSIIKNELSNSVVYDVTEVNLGNISVSYDTCDYWQKEFVTLPVWNVRLKTTSERLTATVNAVTGEIFVTS